MKAISLQLKAFGPYNEEQHIRFEDLGNEAIFLITGPTGAGKTTIFDAICYALYGKASGSDREQDSLRSHFAAETLQTEVRYTFSLKGKKYMVIRAPRQLKKKERGDGFTEDPARAELYEWKENTFSLLSAKVKDVNELLESRLGLDYEQFRKMVMIPQGEFRKLISENSKEREEILQKIFRTYFYEQITEELKAQAKELKSNIQDLEWKIEQEQAKINWINIAKNEEDTIYQISSKLREEINQAELEKKKKEKKQQDLQKTYRTMQEEFFAEQQLADKFAELDKLKQAEKELSSKKEEMNKIKERLQRANRAEQVIPYQEQVEKREKEWKTAQQKLETQQKYLNEAKENHEKTTLDFEEEKRKAPEREQLKEDMDVKKKQLKAVQSYNHLKEKVEEMKKTKDELEGKITTARKAIRQHTVRMTELDKQRDERDKISKAYYEAERETEKLVESLRKIKRFRLELETLLQKREIYVQIKSEYKKIKEQTEQTTDKITKLEEENRKNHALLLAEHLQEGDACPVCGSVHHPNPASGNSFSVTDEELNNWINQKKEQEIKLQAQSEKYHAAKSDGKYQRQRVDQLAEEAGIKLEKQEEWETVSAEVEEQLQLAEKKKSNLAIQLKELDRLTEERKALQESLDQTNKKLEKTIINKENADADWNRNIAKLEELQKEIPEQFRDEKKLTTKLKEIEQFHIELVEKWESIQQKVQLTKETQQQAVAIYEQLNQFAQTSLEKFQHEEAIFVEKRKQAGFASQEEYQTAIIATDEKQRLELLQTEYDQQTEKVASRLQEVAAQIKDKKVPDLDVLSHQLESQEKLVQEIGEELQKIKFYIVQHKQIDETLTTLIAQYEQAGTAYFDVGELADLAKGENHLRLSFERYVLASFLDEILLQANIRLDQLTEHRYHLIRSDQIAKRGAQSGLDLEVLDHHTGQKRSVKTLSGGEGFKAALSLALGMSDVVQAHAGGVQLETLFIDEGFGTLDELSLEQAIDCLKGLQQGNRVLGIISHVPQLKEEIQAKLQVTLTEKGSRAEFVFR